MIIITSINNNLIEGFVGARCVAGYYKVRIKIDGFKIIYSECECGQKFCRHAIQLFMHYMRVRDHVSNYKTIR
ncbi:hypothetical protein SULI_06710 [Saccharolobus solfataricus]|uniref:SWIM-type domain-containing protein n=2 Tax=Saccharolobus solfataricus TaxID=2287 RepID=A0A0E3JXD3_SACSO|nr:hypothetical protein SULB_1353 [Saccharolobus solfataricus]AKA76342.1 hypothetical protein SULC_1351 [Saccharolobus solfataricus]AKA79034.1 hypothetical protein SULA_1352 [Saccharolobus solfataricus]AZF68114.1 hypothetical protein SULG_06710 [Saccharolobus solfataricus]AZF70734.1 hypothetical protein SULH_06710 [Saccharolobus solfataricus]